MEIAEIEGNKEATELLKQKVSSLSSNKPKQDCSCKQQEMQEFKKPKQELKKFNQFITNNDFSSPNAIDGSLEFDFKNPSMISFLSNPNDIEEQMKNGDFPCGMWKIFSKQLETLKQGNQSINNEIIQLQKSMNEIENKTKQQLIERNNLFGKVAELKQILQSQNKLIQSEKAIKILSSCEENCTASFKAKFASEDFKAEQMEWEDVNIFVKLIGQPSTLCQCLMKAGCVSGGLLKIVSTQAEVATGIGITLKERLALKFGIFMIENKEFPPFAEHSRNCALCRQRSRVFVKEYFPELDAEQLETSGLEPKEILMMDCADFSRVFRISHVDSLRLAERVEEMRQFHKQK